MIEISYDETVDMAYISLSREEEPQIIKTISLEDRKDTAHFLLDIEKDGRLRGIEIFNASRYLPKSLIEYALKVKTLKKQPKEWYPGC